ncbi:PAS domain-containing hybrid sensor histidine kinase/response regulator [Noviherbaspirillum galbum]|uniref:histidine kinase n=1 Tax=Noviherbaspirillum galbum TaxID=2709383 RepID=A0A6B3SUB1_9BURK|nr:ATP-binding protein [Noviherbaspirillum galbum]NEX61952.1 response regulator [Noviherbaspirillum galbum]
MVIPNLFQANFNSFPIGNCLLAPTAELTILAVNDVFLKGCSRRREDLVGASLFTAFAGNPDDAQDTGEAALRESIARAMETGQPDKMSVQRYPILVEQAGGEVRYEERFWSATNTPVLGEDGKVLFISHSTTDVTELVRSEAVARESEIRFRALIDATSEVIYRMSPDWKYMHQLDGRGFLKTTTRLDEYRIEDYVHPEDLDLARNKIDEAIRKKAVFALEHRVLRADGSFGWTYSRAVPILNEKGEIREWVGMAGDITDRKEVEEQLKEASKRKDEFLAMLAHELRNPLAPIGAAAELLQMVKLDEASVRQTSQIIGRQVEHITGLVNDLLDVSRVTRGRVELDLAPLNISHVLTDAVEQVSPLVGARRHRLMLDLSPDVVLVSGDKKRLVQVVANLLTNAVKYTPEGGNILLKTALDNDQVRVEVTDNGIGMDPGLVQRAFDLFSQAERTSDRSSGGLGLGLALVKNLVELHGGSARCSSQGIGKGSTFTVILPRLDDQPDHAGRLHGEQILEPGNRPLRILVVDDNVDAAVMLTMLLEAAGHEVSVEHGAYQALERAKADRPDVCLIDIGLPDLDGNQVARHLRSLPENAGTILVAVTGYGQESDRESALAAGFDHHLVKPVNTRQLAAILNKIANT